MQLFKTKRNEEFVDADDIDKALDANWEFLDVLGHLISTEMETPFAAIFPVLVNQLRIIEAWDEEIEEAKQDRKKAKAVMKRFYKTMTDLCGIEKEEVAEILVYEDMLKEETRFLVEMDRRERQKNDGR